MFDMVSEFSIIFAI